MTRHHSRTIGPHGLDLTKEEVETMSETHAELIAACKAAKHEVMHIKTITKMCCENAIARIDAAMAKLEGGES